MITGKYDQRALLPSEAACGDEALFWALAVTWGSSLEYARVWLTELGGLRKRHILHPRGTRVDERLCAVVEDRLYTRTRGCRNNTNERAHIHERGRDFDGFFREFDDVHASVDRSGGEIGLGSKKKRDRNKHLL